LKRDAKRSSKHTMGGAAARCARGKWRDRFTDFFERKQLVFPREKNFVIPFPAPTA
jgi:hypothetical protein